MKFALTKIYNYGARVYSKDKVGTVITKGRKPVVRWDDGTVSRPRKLYARPTLLSDIRKRISKTYSKLISKL